MGIDRRVHSGSPWEQKVAYCRARRVGDFIAEFLVEIEVDAIVGTGQAEDG